MTEMSDDDFFSGYVDENVEVSMSDVSDDATDQSSGSESEDDNSNMRKRILSRKNSAKRVDIAKISTDLVCKERSFGSVISGHNTDDEKSLSSEEHESISVEQPKTSGNTLSDSKDAHEKVVQPNPNSSSNRLKSLFPSYIPSPRSRKTCEPEKGKSNSEIPKSKESDAHSPNSNTTQESNDAKVLERPQSLKRTKISTKDSLRKQKNSAPQSPKDNSPENSPSEWQQFCYNILQSSVWKLLHGYCILLVSLLIPFEAAFPSVIAPLCGADSSLRIKAWDAAKYTGGCFGLFSLLSFFIRPSITCSPQ